MMNSRLEDLMYRAGLTAQGCWDSMDDYDHKAIEKFAQLIVRECANRIDYWESRQGEHSDDLLKHFGVI
jgi:hypothetical protein